MFLFLLAAYLKVIARNSGTRIRRLRYPAFQVYGSITSVQYATWILDELKNAFDKNLLLEANEFNRQNSPQKQFNLSVPDDCHGIVLGRKRTRLSQIENRTFTKFEMRSGNNKRRRWGEASCFRVFGTEAAIKQALDEIRKLLKEALKVKIREFQIDENHLWMWTYYSKVQRKKLQMQRQKEEKQRKEQQQEEVQTKRKQKSETDRKKKKKSTQQEETSQQATPSTSQQTIQPMQQGSFPLVAYQPYQLGPMPQQASYPVVPYQQASFQFLNYQPPSFQTPPPSPSGGPQPGSFPLMPYQATSMLVPYQPPQLAPPPSSPQQQYPIVPYQQTTMQLIPYSSPTSPTPDSYSPQSPDSSPQ